MADFEVECEKCSSELTASLNAIGRRVVLCVEPCEKCMEAEREDGRDEGYEDGKKEAQNA